MLRNYHFSYAYAISNKGLTRGWYFNRLHWTGRHFTKLLSTVFQRIHYGLLIKPYKIIIFSSALYLNTLAFCLKQSSLFKLVTLSDIFASDHPNAIDGRFTVNYGFWTYSYNTRFFIRIFTNLFQPVISLVSLYCSAGWLEREVWDMYGIKFFFHPDLRRILTDYGFRGHPLRKDFPLVGFIELRYDDSFRSIIFEPVELSQHFRFFKFYNPWATHK